MEPEWSRAARIAPLGVTIGEIDADKETAIRKRYDVHAFPTLLLLQDGLYSSC